MFGHQWWLVGRKNYQKESIYWTVYNTIYCLLKPEFFRANDRCSRHCWSFFFVCVHVDNFFFLSNCYVAVFNLAFFLKNGKRKQQIVLFVLLLFCMLFVDSPSKTYTLFPRTAVPNQFSDITTMTYLPDNPGRQNADGGASTSARGTWLLFSCWGFFFLDINTVLYCI